MRAEAVTILRGVLRDGRRSILGWTVGAMLVSIFYLSFYPVIGDRQMSEILAIMPEGMMEAFGMADVDTAAGYANATVYALLGLIVVLICAIATGARVIGGEEESGVLELEYTAPVSRSQVYCGRIGALWLALTATVMGVSVAVTALNLVADLGIDYGRIWTAGIGMLLITGAFGTITLAVGAATGRRGHGLIAGAGLAVVCYLLNAVGPAAGIEWMSTISPFGWYGGSDILTQGPAWGGYGLLALLAAVPAAGGWLALRRRDLMV